MDSFREAARRDFGRYFADSARVEGLVEEAVALQGFTLRLRNLSVGSDRDLSAEFGKADLFA
jgi:hypothetical protein